MPAPTSFVHYDATKQGLIYNIDGLGKKNAEFAKQLEELKKERHILDQKIAKLAPMITDAEESIAFFTASLKELVRSRGEGGGEEN